MAIDLILLIMATAGFWLGYTKGIVATLFTVLSYVVAVLITIIFSPWLSGLLIEQFGMNQMLALVLGTLFFFIVTLLLIRWLTKKSENYLKKGNRNVLSKILGGVVMMLMGVIFYSFLLLMVNQFNLIGEKIKLASISYKTLETIPVNARVLAEEFKPLFRRYWELMQESTRESSSGTPG